MYNSITIYYSPPDNEETEEFKDFDPKVEIGRKGAMKVNNLSDALLIAKKIRVCFNVVSEAESHTDLHNVNPLDSPTSYLKNLMFYCKYRKEFYKVSTVNGW